MEVVWSHSRGIAGILASQWIVKLSTGSLLVSINISLTQAGMQDWIAAMRAPVELAHESRLVCSSVGADVDVGWSAINWLAYLDHQQAPSSRWTHVKSVLDSTSARVCNTGHSSIPPHGSMSADVRLQAG